jgi:hypothetical protein
MPITDPYIRSDTIREGYPPDNEGICTDVYGEALKNAG